MPSEPIERVLERHTPALMAVAGVVGTGQGLCGPREVDCILVLVGRRTPALLARIPRTLDGYPVEVQEVGEIVPRKG